MTLPPEIEKYQQTFRLFSPGLKKIFAAMDKGYQEAAAHYGFNCDGCRDNCCRSFLFHHTFLEYFYIQTGYHTLGAEKQVEVKSRADAICNDPLRYIKRDRTVRPMCPLNFDERCILYSHRPMICRLHGIPHEFKRADRETQYGPGCQEFTRNYAHKDYIQFDRSSFYLEMAGLEKDFKQKAGITKKMKMTMAEIIATFGNDRYEK